MAGENQQGSVPNSGHQGPLNPAMSRQQVNTGLGDNQQQNQPGNQQPPDNNSGGDDDLLAGFWDDDNDNGGNQQQQPANLNAPQQNQQPQNQQQQPQRLDVNQALQQLVSGMEFPDAMNDAIMTQMAEGDVKGFNDSIKQVQSRTVQQTLQLTGQMMQQMQSGIMQQVESMVAKRLNERDNSGFLAGELPQMDESTKPVVQALFNQALAKSKGDKQRALKMTRQMVQRMGITTGGNNKGPDGSNQQNAPAKIDWGKEFGLTS